MGSVEGESAERPVELRRMWWDVLAISLAFTLLFTAYQSTANLQSSINTDAGLGTASLSTVYIALILSCVFVPTWLIGALGVKWTMSVCMLGYAAYIGAQFYPDWYTLIPGAVVVGLVAAPMWSAKCTYLTHLGALRAKALDTAPEVQVTKLFGIFFLFFQLSQVIGNLISSTVLSSGDAEPIQPNDPGLELCGASFCPWDTRNGTAGERPENSKIYLLMGIYLGCAVIASGVVAAFVDPLTRFGDRIGSGTGLSGWQLLMATLRHLVKDKRQMLLVPLTIYSGLEQGFVGADFTLSYVTCAWGVQYVGYVMITFGACDALFSFAFGEMIKIIGRPAIFTIGAVLDAAMIATLFLWKPTPDQPAVFFVIAGLWGIADAVWQTQLNALYGNLFPNNEEAAFSNYRLWESLGFAVAYAYSSFICTDAKLIILAVILFVGMIGYYLVEYIEHKTGKAKTESKLSLKQ